MTFLPRYAIAVALVMCSAAICACAQTPSKPARKGSVAGRVTIKGKPVSGVFVGMRASDYGSSSDPVYKAATDQDGRYNVSDVPAGSYQVFPIAPAYVSADNNNGRETLVLGEGETVEGIDFALVRGGVITGKVVDADGRPAIEQQVSLVAAEPAPNQRGSVNVFAGAQTDDRGIYRLFGVAAGRYKITSGQGENSYNRGRLFFKQSFYTEDADATDASKATVIEVTEGSETTNIDIVLGRTMQTFAASGRIVDGENGQPISNSRIGMQHIVDEHGNSHVGVNTSSNSKGEFRVENLAPGKYSVFVAPAMDSDLRSDAVPFDVVDQDVSGLVVKITKGSASVAGNIVLENTDDKAVFAKLTQLRIQAFIQSSPRLGPGMPHSTAINPDGSFTLMGLEPGALYFSISGRDRTITKGFVIARVERDGVVEPRGVELKSGDQITNVRLVASYGNATIHGVVKVDDGPPPAGAHVYLQITKDGDTRTHLQSPPVDARGHFVVEEIPSGLYNFEANIFIPGIVGKPTPPVRQQFNVVDGVVTEVTITFRSPGP